MKEFQALGLDISIVNDKNEVVGLKEMEEEEDREELEQLAPSTGDDIPLPPPSDPDDGYVTDDDDEDDDELSDDEIDKEFNEAYENDFMEGEDE